MIPITKPENRFTQNIVNIVVFGAIFSFLLYYFRPSLIFSNTNVTGGDTAAHINWAWYLKKYLLPKGQIAGWAPDWYAGFPLFQYYFPLAFIVIALLSYLIPYAIAFKIVTVVGVFLLPVGAFCCFKWMKFDFPAPLLAALLTLPFLFLESYSIYGANILSTLAGEFSFTISVALTLFFFGLLFRGIQENKYQLINAILLALIALTHVITVIFILLAMPFFTRGERALANLKYLVKVFALGFGLTAFWSLPFVAKLSYSTHMAWGQLRGLGFLFPTQYAIVLILALVGLGFGWRKDDKTRFLAWLLLMPAALFLVLPDGRLYNGRVLPFFYLFAALWAAYALFRARQSFSFAFYKVSLLPQRCSDYIMPFLALTIIFLSILGTSAMVRPWIEWNYSGYESKPAWGTFKAVNDYLKRQPSGRVMWERSDSLNKFGSPLAFMTLPYFSGQPTMEAILIESSFTSPFHFVNQAEVSEKGSQAVPGIKYPDFDLDAGIRHMRLFDIKYYIAMNAKTVRAADASKELKLLKRIDEFSIYELKTDGMVVVPKYKPLVVKTNKWIDSALKWYSMKSMLDVPVVSGNTSVKPPADWTNISERMTGVKKVPIRSSAPIKATVGNDEIVFNTSEIGKPHWIKMSYFPNWKVEGADGPYLATPSFMMVVPRTTRVRLYYDRLPVDWLGLAISLVAMVTIIFLAIKGLIAKLRRVPI